MSKLGWTGMAFAVFVRQSLMVIGLHKPEICSWRFFVEDPSLGLNLLRFVATGKSPEIALKELRGLYRSHGFL
jgi:hypothetical protein